MPASRTFARTDCTSALLKAGMIIRYSGGLRFLVLRIKAFKPVMRSLDAAKDLASSYLVKARICTKREAVPLGFAGLAFGFDCAAGAGLRACAGRDDSDVVGFMAGGTAATGWRAMPFLGISRIKESDTRKLAYWAITRMGILPASCGGVPKNFRADASNFSQFGK